MRVGVFLGIAFLVLGLFVGVLAGVVGLRNRYRNSSPKLRSLRIVRVSLANAFWSRIASPSFSSSLPARSSIHWRHSSTAVLAQFRRRLAGQLLAHDQAERVGDRHVGAHARLGEAARVQALFQSGGQVVRDALHRERSDGLDARLLGRFEHRRAIRRLRAVLIVKLVLVIGPAQRIGIARAAHDRDFVRRQIARGQRQPCLQAFERRRLGAEIDLELRLAREAAHRDRDRALERLGGILGFHLALPPPCGEVKNAKHFSGGGAVRDG